MNTLKLPNPKSTKHRELYEVINELIMHYNAQLGFIDHARDEPTDHKCHQPTWQEVNVQKPQSDEPKCERCKHGCTFAGNNPCACPCHTKSDEPIEFSGAGGTGKPWVDEPKKFYATTVDGTRVQIIPDIRDTIQKTKSDEPRCGCGEQKCIGGAEVEIGGVCHRPNNPCFQLTPHWESDYAAIWKKWYGSEDGYNLDDMRQDILELIRKIAKV